MFDKNTFKEAFHCWVVNNPTADESAAREFCQEHIPANVYLQYYWLVTQSLEWFRWLHRRTSWSADELDGDENDDSLEERVVC